MNETVYQGKTLEEALEQAGNALGVAADELEYEVTEENNGGFWGFDESYIRVRAWVPTPAADTATASADDEPPPEHGAERETVPDAQVLVEEETPVDAGTKEEPDSREEEPKGGGTGGFWDAADDSGSEDDGPVARAEEAEADPPGGTDDNEEATTAEQPEIDSEAETVVHKQEAPGAASAAEARTSDTEGETRHSEDTDSEAGPEIEELVKKVLAGMDFDCTVDVQSEGDVYMAMVGGPDKELLLDGNGRPLSALELILNHAFRHRLSERRKIRVDAGDFRSRREDELRDLAFQVAHSAKETARTQETQPLNPYERRLVHLALAEDSGVTTRSRGSGFLKNVQVIPRGSGRGHR